MELIAPCHFGLEAVLKREIYDLGYEITQVQDGRITYEGDWDGVVLSNLHLRTAERILVKVGEFTATSFEEFFQGMKDIPWEEYIPEDGKFWIKKASTVKSRLFSKTDLQSVGKKAMVERMRSHYHRAQFPETGSEYPVRIFILKDKVTVGIDTSGEPLHKRGYREHSGDAPISETLAAALIMLTPWHPDRILADPFCGSGTFLIEAALMAKHIAPGLNRSFTAEQWTNLIPKEDWTDYRKEAKEEILPEVETHLSGYDIDPAMTALARENAKRAGVEGLIHFQTRDVAEFSHSKKYGFIITNPPYGERLLKDGDLEEIYRDLGQAYEKLDSWSMYVITSYEEAQQAIGKKASKNRKIYNGMLQTYFYQYLGPKPPKRG